MILGSSLFCDQEISGWAISAIIIRYMMFKADLALGAIKCFLIFNLQNYSEYFLGSNVDFCPPERFNFHSEPCWVRRFDFYEGGWNSKYYPFDKRSSFLYLLYGTINFSLFHRISEIFIFPGESNGLKIHFIGIFAP